MSKRVQQGLTLCFVTVLGAYFAFRAWGWYPMMFFLSCVLLVLKIVNMLEGDRQ